MNYKTICIATTFLLVSGTFFEVNAVDPSLRDPSEILMRLHLRDGNDHPIDTAQMIKDRKPIFKIYEALKRTLKADPSQLTKAQHAVLMGFFENYEVSRKPNKPVTDHIMHHHSEMRGLEVTGDGQEARQHNHAKHALRSSNLAAFEAAEPTEKSTKRRAHARFDDDKYDEALFDKGAAPRDIVRYSDSSSDEDPYASPKSSPVKRSRMSFTSGKSEADHYIDDEYTFPEERARHAATSKAAPAPLPRQKSPAVEAAQARFSGSASVASPVTGSNFDGAPRDAIRQLAKLAQGLEETAGVHTLTGHESPYEDLRVRYSNMNTHSMTKEKALKELSRMDALVTTINDADLTKQHEAAKALMRS